MAATDKLFAGSIPEIYDRFLVPLIFEPYARDLAERLAKIAPQAVLETAAGTGVLTRAIASRLPADARLVATDLNQPMLDHAKARQPDARIEWKQADALALPFEDRSFDAVRLPVRRDVFSRQGSGLSGGAAGAETGRPLHLQRVGSHFGERIRRCRNTSPGRRSFPTIHRDSWPAFRTAIMTSSKSAAS